MASKEETKTAMAGDKWASHFRTSVVIEIRKIDGESRVYFRNQKASGELGVVMSALERVFVNGRTLVERAGKKVA